jgi:hypothetical protein
MESDKNNGYGSLDFKVNKIMKSLIDYWNNYEKHNYDSNHEHTAYKTFMSYYTGLNPYNVLQEKYQNRIQERCLDVNF